MLPNLSKFYPICLNFVQICQIKLPHPQVLRHCLCCWDIWKHVIWNYSALMLSTVQAVHKKRPQYGGEGGLSSADKGGSSDADVRTFWDKNIGFFEIYYVSARTIKGGWVSVDIFRTRVEGGVNFSRFCSDFVKRDWLRVVAQSDKRLQIGPFCIGVVWQTEHNGPY